MVTSVSDATGTRFRLRGYERTFTMSESVGVKIVHVLTVRGGEGAISSFLQHLPQALVLTFNRHPRMRALQLKNEFAMAEVQPRITLDTVAERKLLEIRQIVGRDGEEGTESWEQYAEDQWHIPFDRYTELPFYVRVWQYPGQGLARVLLFCDHYMSDGISGMVIMNDLVTLASELSRHDQDNEACKKVVNSHKQLPLRPPLNDLWMRPTPVKSFLSKVAVKLFGKMIFADEIKAFRPLIPVRKDQKDLSVPVQVNSSSAYFGLGSVKNLKKTLECCKREGVTFFCACAAAVIVAYYISCDDEKRVTSQPFKVTVDFPFNMRRRVAAPASETQVGCYSATNSLESFAKEGVAMDSVLFWDLARKSKKELDAMLASFLLPLPYLFLDDHLTAKTKPKFFKSFQVAQSMTADVDISNIGKYGYETKHMFQTAAQQLEELVVDSIHVSNSNPHIGSALGMFITSTDKLSYGFMHKYEHAKGKQICDAMVASIEHIGRVETHETMMDVVNAVQKRSFLWKRLD